MATDFGNSQGFGDLVESASGDCTFGLFGRAVFRSPAHPRIQIWFISNGRDHIMATHISDQEPATDEIAEAQQIAGSLTLGPEESLRFEQARS
jgi:hypothetical protein